MNNKITVSSLVAMLALKSGLTKEKSEEFLKEFFNLISDTLKEGESVKIRALGTFKIINVETRKSVNVTNGEEIVIPEHKRIVFVPSKEMAEVVNAPFSMFESVELHPDAEKELEECEEEKVASSIDFQERVEENAGANSDNANSDNNEEVDGNAQESAEKRDDESEENAMKPEERLVIPSAEALEEEAEALPTHTTLSEKKGRWGGWKFIMGFVSGLVVALLLVGLGYWYIINKDVPLKQEEVKSKNTLEEKISEPATESILFSSEEDSISTPVELDSNEVTKASAELPPTKPSDTEVKVIKDVIGPHNYLTTMAQRHYGDFNLWAYIYEENKSFLGHPDRIKPGTEVIVPPLSKYGVDPKNPQDILKAKRLGIEIYNRFK